MTQNQTTGLTSLVALAVIALGAPGFASAAPQAAGGSVFVSQIGDSNRATVRQAAGSAGSVTTLNQSGADNVGRIDQNSAGQQATINQTGSRNAAAVVQGGVAGNELDLIQIGTGNTASIGQAAQVLGNQARIRQDGVGNAISLDQMGANNTAALNQLGDENAMRVVQVGDNNALTWTQEGNRLSQPAVIMPGGTTLTITQTGGQ